MSDVVWAAAIAGGVGLAGNAFTYLAARANRRLDMARLETENERFHEERREPERQNRDGTYHRLLAVLDRYDMWATGYAEGVDDATFEATLAEQLPDRRHPPVRRRTAPRSAASSSATSPTASPSSRPRGT
jgi:hypothetical protein